MLAVAHPDYVQQVLIAKRANYVKGAAYDMVRALTGDSLLTLEGEPWRERRTLAQPAFHRKALETLTAIMVHSGSRYCDDLAKRSASGQEVDMHREMVRLTLDVVIDTLFGRGTVESSQISFEALGNALELVSLNALGVRPACLGAHAPQPQVPAYAARARRERVPDHPHRAGARRRGHAAVDAAGGARRTRPAALGQGAARRGVHAGGICRTTGARLRR